MNLKETLHRKKPVYLGRSINFFVDTIKLPNGKKATREYVDHPGAVAVAPLLENGDVVMVEQYRYPVGEITLEIPAGKLDKGEGLLTCVRRELAEETGYAARRIEKIASFWPAPAFSNELLHVYRARGLARGQARPDHDEFLRVRTVRFEKALRMIKDGRIQDSKTIIALLANRVWPS